MAHKNYYVILGVSPTATTQGIQRAFRTLAKQYHPDRVGPQSTSAFVESLNVEVILSPEEARRGGVLRLGGPVFTPCMRCTGTGHTWGVSCLACMGQGMIEQEEVMAVRIPPQVRHGTILDMPLRGLGLHNFYLRLHIAVTAWG